MCSPELSEPKQVHFAVLCILQLSSPAVTTVCSSPSSYRCPRFIILHCIFHFFLLCFACHPGVLFQFGSRKHTFVILTSPFLANFILRVQLSPPLSVLASECRHLCRQRFMEVRANSNITLLTSTVAVRCE